MKQEPVPGLLWTLEVQALFWRRRLRVIPGRLRACHSTHSRSHSIEQGGRGWELEALLRLRQAACHPGLIDQKRGAAASAKLDVLLEQVEEVSAGGHKALVFSQFTSFLALVRQRLDARVDRFQSDDACPLFLISLRAGGQGLNLTAADYVFVLDPWRNPAVEAQAIDRAHRIGQEKRVIALRLIARDLDAQGTSGTGH